MTESTREFVAATIAPIQAGYLRSPQSSRSRADLAKLRRGVGQEAGTVPEILYLTMNPDDRWSKGYEGPTPDERAIHLALTLYAVHQQSQHRAMHVADRSFGAALGRLRYTDGQENPGVLRRFQALGTATDLHETAEHARALITLLRRAGIGFDYGRFAQDLVLLQLPAHSDAVRLVWGRDFYQVRETAPGTTDTTIEESA